jgi:hypothetical protein
MCIMSSEVLHKPIVSYPTFRQTDEQGPAGITAGVEFGTLNPNGRCVNFGICKITTDQAVVGLPGKKVRCLSAKAHIILNDRASLQFFFPSAEMLPCTRRAVFFMEYFPVPQDFVLPPGLRALLPPNAPELIRAGRYPIRKEERGYWVAF